MTRYFTQVALRDGTVLTGPTEEKTSDGLTEWCGRLAGVLDAGASGFLENPDGGLWMFPGGDNISYISIIEEKN